MIRRSIDRVVVIGAGIAGLTAAHEVVKARRDVRVFESAARVGGYIETVHSGDYLFESGPNSFPSGAQEIRSVARDVGIEGELIDSRASAAQRLIYLRKRLHAMPTGPKALFASKMFSFAEKVRILAERFVPRGPVDNLETVARFCYRRFGAAPTRTLADAFISGVFAGDARKIGMKAAFPELLRMEQEHGSLLKAMAIRAKAADGHHGLRTFRGGMGRLPDAMAAALGERVTKGTTVRSVAEWNGGFRLGVERDGSVEEVLADAVIVATPAETAERLIAGLAPLATDLLAEVEHAPLICVHAGFDADELVKLPHAFGFLVPRPQRVRTMGWLFSSRTFEGRAPEGRLALTGYIGGVSDSAIVNAHESAVRHIMLGELSLALRMSRIPKPEVFFIVRHVHGLPQYAVGHERRIAAVRHILEETPRLKLAGNYLDGISLNDCIKSARRAAAELFGEERSGAAAESSG